MKFCEHQLQFLSKQSKRFPVKSFIELIAITSAIYSSEI